MYVTIRPAKSGEQMVSFAPFCVAVSGRNDINPKYKDESKD